MRLGLNIEADGTAHGSLLLRDVKAVNHQLSAVSFGGLLIVRESDRDATLERLLLLIRQSELIGSIGRSRTVENRSSSRLTSRSGCKHLDISSQQVREIWRDCQMLYH